MGIGISALSGGGSGGASLIHQGSLTLSNAQVLAWTATGYAVIPAPGSSRVLKFLNGVLLGRSGTAYGNIQMDCLISFQGSASGSDVSSFVSTSNVNAVLGMTGANGQVDAGQDAYITTYALSAADALHICLLNSGNLLNGGAGGNAVVVCCAFQVFDPTTGLYLTTTESGWNQATRTFA